MDNIVLLATRLRIANKDRFRTHLLPEICKIQAVTFRRSVVFGSHTCCPVSPMGKKRTAACHSSAESEIVSLDAGLRIEGTRALQLWDRTAETFSHSDAEGNLQCPSGTRHYLAHSVCHFDMGDHVPSNIPGSSHRSYIHF